MIPQSVSHWPTGSLRTSTTHSPQTHSDRDDFLRYIGEHLVSAIAIDDSLPPPHTRLFVPISALRFHLTRNNIRKLLVNDTPTGSSWRQIQQDYLVVFAILIYIDKVIYLKVFLKDPNLSDSNLPFAHSHNWPPECLDFFEIFQEAQWQFCAQKLEANRLNGRQMDKRVILPIIQKRLIKSGVFSTAFEVEIDPEYNFLVQRDEHDRPITNTFFLKTCVPGEAEYHHKEIEAYNYLRDEEDILPYLPQYYGSWVHNQSYNMLLEYVRGGTLTQFMERTEVPADPKDILQVWTGLLNLIKPLMRIHSLRHVYQGHRELRGIHHDIKPDNILVTESSETSVFDVTFKLADLGLTDFDCVEERMKKGTSRNNHGTQMYSPPELCVEDNDKFLQRTILDAEPSKDIWALGCVFSEAAAWADKGKAGLLQYRKLRSMATQTIPRLRQTSHVGCFHDGKKVLKEVRNFHLSVLHQKRQGDQIIQSVIGLVNEMLGEATSRPTAQNIYYRSKDYLNTAKSLSEKASSSNDDNDYRGIFALPDSPERQAPPVLPSESEFAEQGLGLDYPSNQRLSPEGPLDERIPSKRSISSSPSPPEDFSHTNTSLSLPESSPDLCQSPNAGTTQLPLAGGVSLSPTNSQQTSHSPRHSDRSVNFETETIVPVPLDETSQSTSQLQESRLPVTYRDKFPEVTIKEIECWAHRKKFHSCVSDLPGMDRLKSLNGRDQIFLVDDSSSMARHSKDVKRAVAALGHLVEKKDPDGIELRLTNDASFIKSCKNRHQLVGSLGAIRYVGQCDISQTLGRILKDVKDVEANNTKNIKRRRFWFQEKKKKFGTNIYVLTDGIWEDSDDWLMEIVQSLKRLINGGLSKGEVGIEFIQFGSDPIGTERLRILDDGLKEYGVEKDFIDTEPFDGNVYKMLLGSTFSDVDRQSTGPLSMSTAGTARPGSLEFTDSMSIAPETMIRI